MKPKQPRPPTTFDDQGFAAHKGHYHDKSGKKFASIPTAVDEDVTPVQDTPPDEEDVAQEAVKVERKKRRRGVRKLSTAQTVLTGSGNTLG